MKKQSTIVLNNNNCNKKVKVEKNYMNKIIKLKPRVEKEMHLQTNNIYRSKPLRRENILFCSLLLSLLLGCSGVQIAKNKISNPGQMVFNGYVNPEANCYSCHNGDGRGTWKGENLTELKGLDKERVIDAINNGPGMFMPSFEDTLTSQEKQQLTDWIMSVHGK